MQHNQIDPRAAYPAPEPRSEYLTVRARRVELSGGRPAFRVIITAPGRRQRVRTVSLDYAWPTDTVERRRHAIAEALGISTLDVFDGWGSFDVHADRYPFAVSAAQVTL